MNLPKISIITPTYNSEKNIEACITSVANQTHQNIEHIIIDGASADNTLNIIKEIAAKYTHLKFISEPDRGIYDAMNKGIDIATGEWIYFLGSDDVFIDDLVLEEVFSNPGVKQVDIVYGGVQYKYSEEQYNIPFDYTRLRFQNINHQAMFTRKLVFDKVGKFNTKYKIFADWEFNIRWMGSTAIPSLYMPRLIAVFNEKGLSGSRKIDKDFQRDKYMLFEKYWPAALHRLEPEVSVFIINDNKTQDIPRLIQSVLNQSYPFFKLYIINLVHIPGSYTILEWYARQDTRVEIHNLPGGQLWNSAINELVRKSKAKWLWIVTPKVYPDECFLESFLPHAEGNVGAGLVLCACRLYHHSALVGKFPADSEYEGNRTWLHNAIIDGKEAITSTFIYHNPIVSISTVLIKRDVYIQAGGIKQYSSPYWDWLLYIEILLHAKLIYIAIELSFVVYPEKTLDKKLGKATKIMSLAEYTEFISALITIFQSNNYITSLLLKLYSEVWHMHASKGVIRLGHLKLMSQMLKPLQTKVKGSLYKKLLLTDSNFSSVSQSVLKQLLEKNNFGSALKHHSKQSLTHSAKPYLVELPKEVVRERPRILHVIANFITGGSSRLVVDLIEHLGTEYEQEIVVPYLPNPPGYVGQVIRALGGHQAEEINKYIAEFNPHIIHVHYWGKCDFKWYELFFRAAEANGIPVIENINVPVQPYYSRSIKEYVYVSKFVLDMYATPNTEGSVIYPGSDFSLFRSSIDLSKNNCIGMVYRLDQDKLNENSIDVFIKVAQQKKDVKCLIVGGGYYYKLYNDKVKKAGVEDNFEFTGYVEYTKLQSLYEKMGIFVAPVWDESFGQVSPFAMSMGLPVVGYNVGALNEIIGNDSLLVSPGDSNQLANLIINLLHDQNIRALIAQSNCQRAEKLFSVQVMVQNYSILYKRLLEEK